MNFLMFMLLLLACRGQDEECILCIDEAELDNGTCSCNAGENYVEDTEYVSVMNQDILS